MNLLVDMAKMIFKAESKLREQRFDLISAILRENGGCIEFRYRTLGVLYDNCWHDIERIVLVNDEDYEVYCLDRLTGELIDIEDIARFEISGDKTVYDTGDFLELLCEIVEKGKLVNA